MEPLHTQHAYHHEGLRQRYDHDRRPLDHKVPPPMNTTGQPQQKARLSPTQQTHTRAGNQQAGVPRHGTPPQGQLRSPPPQYQPHPHQAQQTQQQQQQQQHQQQQQQHQSHNHQQYTQHMPHSQQQPNGLSTPILLLLFVSFALYVTFVPWAGNPPAPAVSTTTAVTATVSNVQQIQAANPQVNVNNHNIMHEIAAVAGEGFQERSLAREGQMHNVHALHRGLQIPMEESRNVAGESRDWQGIQNRREGSSGFSREAPGVRRDEYGVGMMRDGVGVFSDDSRQAVVMPPASVYSNARQNTPHSHQPMQPLVPRATPDESLMSVFMQQANIPQYVPSGPANGNSPPRFQANGIPARQQPQQQPLQQLQQQQQPQQPHLPPHQQQPQYHHNEQGEQAVTPQKGQQYRGPDPPLHPSVSLPSSIQKQPETIFSSLTVTVTEQVPLETYQPRPLSEMSATEQTFIAIKPDGVQRGLIGPIISRFESRGFKLAAIKLVTPGKAHLEQHYADLAGKPFFNGLIEYMNSGPICAMVWEGRDAVKTGRTILGATNPLASAPGTIRGDYAIDVGRNVCHGSDSVENAKKEIALWFKEGDLISWKSSQFDWVYEKP